MAVDMKVYLTEIGWKDVDWTGTSGGRCEQCNGATGCIE